MKIEDFSFLFDEPVNEMKAYLTKSKSNIKLED